MSSVELGGVAKRFSGVAALDHIDLRIPAGSIVAVLGPSGCGKTTLLRVLAGFERPDAGTIHIGGALVSGAGTFVPPERRRIGIVPQEGALFPHLTVARNVAYGLRRAERTERVAEVLALVGLAGLDNRYPRELSGGQQQRVAVARALAPRPAVVLLDEPFSALDAPLRAGLRADVQQAFRDDGATAVLVTHDQAEALSLADSVAVMRAGQIVQVATPGELYQNPRDVGVASFVGDAIVLDAVVTDGRAETPLGHVRVSGRPGAAPPHGPTTLLLRPEQLALVSGEAAGVAGEVVGREYFGHDVLLTIRLATGDRYPVRVTARSDRPVGSQVVVHATSPARVMG